MMVYYAMTTIWHKFVELIPDQLEDGVLYISIKYCTAIHKCCCGCQEEVVTPLSPTDWQLIFDGKTVSLYPSIGNWSFKCKSHYWIRNNKVIRSGKLSDEKINAGRYQDHLNKMKYFKEGIASSTEIKAIDAKFKREKPESKNKFWKKIRKWLS